MNLREISDTDLYTHSKDVNAEISRRNRLKEIPQEISNLAQQGLDIGLEESTMIDAVTNLVGCSLEIDESQA